MSPKSLRGKQAVFLVEPPPDWKPTSLWSVPPGFTGGTLHAKNLPMHDALGFGRASNKSAMERQQQTGEPIKEWAIVSRHLRPRWHGHPDRREGGAA